MRKKLPYILLTIVLFIQICVPVGMIVYQKIDSNLAEAKGEKFRFALSHLSYSNQGKLSFVVDTKSERKMERLYAEIEVSDDGFVKLNLTDNKPENNHYIKSASEYKFKFPINEIDTGYYDNVYSMIFYNTNSDYDYNPTIGYCKEAYLEAYVYKGRVDGAKIYIDGLAAEEYLSILNDKLK